ncbi:3-dehydroquinate synthase [Peribacillus saganii]|uniref:3-dehydroquinate synthase n=1 Tax=Peribacillus saganii TaxID=2303992 RepID=A0A372LNN9_9BACI|nr:3-dehydroquinate synthase [Peribacillus saganii]RFU68494.1 3-dehydroquinate synthase [Peribacillus saganii]
MEQIIVQTTSEQYPVYIGKDAINRLPDFLNSAGYGKSKLLIITDKKVASLHLETVKMLLQNEGFSVIDFVVPEGEFAKTFEVFYQSHTYALEAGLNRKSLILALGGGAVGDLAGFVAATFMRGVPFIQIPTTLLAHDSAVGGKVAINHPLGKNMIGAFHQPIAVFYDLAFLHTLPLSELRSGFAEVIKHGLIQDQTFFKWLTENISGLDELIDEQLSYMILKGVGIKAAIVKEDEKESGIRAFLNLGHTLGHAIESEMGYGKISHGEGVIIGTIFALKLSMKELDLRFDLPGLIKWLDSLGYRTSVPAELNSEKLIAVMKKDKKTVTSKIRFVLLEQIGIPKLVELSDKTIHDVLVTMYS